MEIFQEVFDMRFLKLGLSIKPQKPHTSQISESRVCVPVWCRHPGATTASHHTLGLVTHRLVPPLSGVQRAKIRGATGSAPSGGSRGRSFLPLPAPGPQASLAWGHVTQCLSRACISNLPLGRVPVAGAEPPPSRMLALEIPSAKTQLHTGHIHRLGQGRTFPGAPTHLYR